MEILTPGERILLARHRARFTKKELSMRSGVSVATITKYEHDEVEFDHEVLLALAMPLSVTSNRIKFGFDQPDNEKLLEPLIKPED